jgi:hypothetical protein
MKVSREITHKTDEDAPFSAQEARTYKTVNGCLTIVMLPCMLFLLLFDIQQVNNIVHRVQVRFWPQTTAVISQATTVHTSDGVRNVDNYYTPKLVVHYRYAGLDYRDVVLEDDFDALTNVYRQDQADRYMQRYYPVGGTFKIAINPEHLDAPRVAGVTPWIEWDDVWMLGWSAAAWFMFINRKRAVRNAVLTSYRKPPGKEEFW